jgi:erythronate-4-phosphate dehydrogenase
VRIVADAAIPYLDEMLGDAARIERHPGARIDRTAVKDADALLVRSVTRVDEALLAGSRVRFVGSATAGTDHVDRDVLERHGVAFAHSPGCNASAVVQYVTTALYQLARRDDPSIFARPIGVIGFGQVGSRLAARLRALGHRVLANDPPLERHGTQREAFVSLEELLAECSVVSLHVPLTTPRESSDPTVHLLDADRVRAAIEAGTHLINTSRGGVLDEGPLLTAPGRGRAVLDTWEHEPRLSWPLLAPQSPVSIATPHVAGYSLEGKREATRMVVEQLASALGLTVSALPTPPEPGPVIEADAAATVDDALADTMLRTCDLERDDASLRALLGRPEHERPAAFEALRAGYPLRREPSAWRIRAARPELRARLAAAGFALA